MANDQPIKAGGGYNINWDEIDETYNPFQSQKGKKLCDSPGPTNSLVSPVKASPLPVIAEPVSKVPTVNGSRVGIVQEIQGDSSALVPTNVSSIPGASTVSEDISDLLPLAVDSPNEITGAAETTDPDVTQATNARRLSNSSAATFVLTPDNRSPVPPDTDAELDADLPPPPPPPPDEEVLALRAEKLELQTLVADMQRCISEYERSLQQLAKEKARAEEAAKESVINVISERDQAVEEISTIEKAFGDLHRRFEKSKLIIEGFKKNEELLKKSAEDFQAQVRAQEKRYKDLKALVEKQLIKAAEETEKVKRDCEGEVTLLRAAIKRSELQIKSLESQVEQKVRENSELTKICDELISKYSEK